MIDFKDLEAIANLLTIIAILIWIIDMIFSRIEKNKASKLNKLEQEAEIAKHKAEEEKAKRMRFDKKLENLRK